MKYTKIKADLFSKENKSGCMLCHCISSDFALGAGIARIFNQKGVREKLLQEYKSYQWNGNGACLITYTGFLTANLVTKEKYWHKPTLMTMRQSLVSLKIQLEHMPDITELAMPAIGCGLDKLSWNNVKRMIKEIFDDTDITITVCTI